MREFGIVKRGDIRGIGMTALLVSSLVLPIMMVKSANAQSSEDSSSAFWFHDLDAGSQDGARSEEDDAGRKSIEALEYAAQEGDEIAMWRLGRHYSAEKQGKADHLRAFEMFSKLVRSQQEQTPYSDKAPFTAYALVSLGTYYRTGIPDTHVTKNPDLAWSMFMTAATYYGDPKAQYSLFDMCDSELTDRCSTLQAGRWLKRSAENGDIRAQARLGFRQFEGEKGLNRDKISGLTWLTIARERAHIVNHASVFDLHERAFSLSTSDERHEARARAEKWMQNWCNNVLSC